jgi:signal transduction histidine kinase
MKLYIKRKILIGLIASIVIIMGLGLVSYLYFNKVMKITKEGAHSRRIQSHVEQVRTNIVEIETSQWGYGLTGSELFLDTYPKAIQLVNFHLAKLDSLSGENSEQKRRIKQLKEAVAQRIEFSREVIRVRKESFEKAKDMVMTLQGRKQMTVIKTVIDKIQGEESRLIIERSFNTSKQFFQFVTAFLGLIACTLGLLTILIYMINANTKSRMIAEEKLRQAEKETLKINKELEAFSYSVSHDLRAPLRSINGYTQILKEEYGTTLDNEGNRMLNVIITNAKRMGQLIDDLLAFSRLGRQDIRKTKINMDELVKPLLDEMNESNKDRKIVLDIHPLGNVFADGSMIQQVWVNLLSNAFKYTQKNDKETRIEVGATKRATETVFYVKDNGVGFSMDYAHKLFGVFQRLHKTEEFEGTGVGLALVKQIIDRHEGKIWAEAALKGGATFYFSLPNNHVI